MIDVEVEKARCRYMDEFLKCSCSPKLLSLKLFPNAKEITESFAAYEAVRSRCDFRFDDPDVTCVCVGDGHTPRTGAVFAYRSKWMVYSVDPNMRVKEYGVDRLFLRKKRIEDIDFFTHEKVVIVAVHSHASLESAIISVGKPKHLFVVAIPCCFDQFVTGVPCDDEYEDEGIWSPHRTVLVWENAEQFYSKREN